MLSSNFLNPELTIYEIHLNGKGYKLWKGKH